ncbi:SEC-C metal-binding domain-containing protein [Pseudomonas sp. CHM02]|uniref:SEC-C metal-binding domain-containing protein n=1 Tax=Pseudomonas sp. CHM02 TaxID=1463662 RepID=UPI000472F115|nr:SEC-C metal-binding domain-containing protein [Pseudomonas sp. CHM02]
MNDIEFAHRVSPQLGNLYEQAKNLGASTPGYAVTFLRSFAEAFCETLVPTMDRDLNLDRKIACLRDRRLVDHRVLNPLRILQKNGNVAAHPKAFSYTPHDSTEMLNQALPAALGLLEYLHSLNPVLGECPEYTVTPFTQHNLRELSYIAIFEEDAEARYTLGVHFKEKANALKASEVMFRADDGYGLESRKSIDQANIWFKLAAESSHVEAMYEYGVYHARLQGDEFQEQRQKGEHWVWRASDKGYASALAFIGDCHFWGSARYEQDFEYARELYQQAAVQSHPGALAQLGEMHERGIGGPRDLNASFECSLQSAEAGFPQAQFHLYTLHHQGHAFADDRLKAIAWLIEAAEQKYPEAMLELGRLISQKLIPGRSEIDAQTLYEQCLNSEKTRIKARYALAHSLVKQLDNLDALQSALTHITNCQDEITVTSQHKDLLPACRRLAAYIWEKIPKAMASAYPHLTFQISVPPPIADEPHQRVYVGSPVGRNEQCPCGSEKKYKHCCR